MAENKDGQEKTEQATTKRLHEARMRGQVSKSQDVTTAAVMLFGALTVFFMGGMLTGNVKSLMAESFANLGQVNINAENFQYYYVKFIAYLGQTVAPILFSVLGIILAAEIAQVGLKIANKKFTEGLNWKQIANPFSGLKKVFFSGRSFFELFKSLLKLLILGGIVYQTLASKAEETVALTEKSFEAIAKFFVATSFEIVFKVAVVYILIAVMDWIYQKYRFREDMKMTKHEVKEETKQAEGDPKVKARLRQLMRGRIRQLMMKNVEEADVVITNPTHYAVALKYDRDTMSAPVLTAKGADYIALNIRKIAEKHGVPIVEEPPLARALYSSVELRDEVPEFLFKAVAQVLAYVYNLRQKSSFSMN